MTFSVFNYPAIFLLASLNICLSMYNLQSALEVSFQVLFLRVFVTCYSIVYTVLYFHSYYVFATHFLCLDFLFDQVSWSLFLRLRNFISEDCILFSCSLATFHASLSHSKTEVAIVLYNLILVSFLTLFLSVLFTVPHIIM